MNDHSLRQALSDAYSEETGCPEPSVFVDLLEGRLDDAMTAAVAEHAGHCPACAAERDLARSFVCPRSIADPAGLDHVTARLDATRPWSSDAVRSARLGRRWPIPMALAASVLLALGGLRLLDFAPQLPDTPADDRMRGTVLEAIAPLGDIMSPPEALQWETLDVADHYIVTIRAVDDRVIWQQKFRDSPALIPEKTRAEFNPAVTYYWEVDARNSAEASLARSGSTGFRVLPGNDAT